MSGQNNQNAEGGNATVASLLLAPTSSHERLAPHLAGLLGGTVLVGGAVSLTLLRAVASVARHILLLGTDRHTLALLRRGLVEDRFLEVDAIVTSPQSPPLAPGRLDGALLVSDDGRLEPWRSSLPSLLGEAPLLAIVPSGRAELRSVPPLAMSGSHTLLRLAGATKPARPADSPPRVTGGHPRAARAARNTGATSVSLIIPTRDRARLLSRALSSVSALDRAPQEILVVDDGSTDETRELLAAHAGGVRAIHREQPGGQGAAMNDGIAAATGDWIAWLDDDDIFLPAKLRLQLRTITDPAIGLTVTAHFIGNASGQPTAIRWLPEFRDHQLLRLLLRGSIFLGPTALVRRAAYLELGDRPYDESLPRAADYEIWWRLARRWRVAVLQVPLTVVCRHPANQLDRERARLIYESTRRTLRWVRETIPLAELAGGVEDSSPPFGVRLERAQALLRVGLGDEARADLEALDQPEHELIGPLLGLTALESGDLAAAEAAFARVLARSPQSIDALNGLATTCLVAGRRAEAERLLSRAVGSGPDQMIRYNLALARENSPTAPGPATSLIRELLSDRLVHGAHYSPAPPLRGLDAYFTAFRRQRMTGA